MDEFERVVVNVVTKVCCYYDGLNEAPPMCGPNQMLMVPIQGL
jgi:hypothetical protein